MKSVYGIFTYHDQSQSFYLCTSWKRTYMLLRKVIILWNLVHPVGSDFVTLHMNMQIKLPEA